MVRIGELEIPTREIGEELGRRARRGSRVAIALTILAAKTFHRSRPYPALAGLAGLTLGVAPFFIEAPNQAKMAMAGGSVPLTLVAAQGLLSQAKDDDQAEDDEEFYRNLNREAYRDTQAMELEAGFLALREQNYSLLPLHARPDRYDFTEFAKGQQSAGQKFMASAEEAMKKAFADLPDGDEDGDKNGDGQKAIAPGASTSAAKPAAQFRELDLAQAAAENDKSLLVSGVSGVGKTRFLQHAIHAINQEYEGNQVFLGVDFKGSKEHFCGLEKSQSFVISPAPGRDYKFAAAQINDVVDMLGNREGDFPLYLLVDEINNGLEQAKCQGNAYGRKPEEVLKSNLKFIATQGRERNIRGILTAHGNLMGMLGIDGDTAQSLVCAVLGRKVAKGDGFALIGKVLNNQVLFSKDERQKLSAEFNRIRSLVEPTGQAIALTNIEGDWEFVLLPARYKYDPGMLSLEPQNQGITQLMTSATPKPEAAPAPPKVEPQVTPLLPEKIPETLKPFLEWAIALTPDSEGWLSIAESFGTLPEALSKAYPDLMAFAKFLAKLNSLDVVDIKPGFEGFKLTDGVAGKLAIAEDKPEAIDPDIYSRLQQWLAGTGAKYFENGAIEVRSICQSFKVNGQKLDAPTVKIYLAQMVSDGLGDWVDFAAQKFAVKTKP